MIGDNDDALEIAEKTFKDTKDYLESGGKPVTASDISNIGACMIDGINSGIEDSVLGVSLKRASESMKVLSNAFPPLSGKVKKGGK